MAYPVVPLIPAGNSSFTTSGVLQNAATADGNGTDYDITGMAAVQLLINPVAYTGTVLFFGSIDGTTFKKIKGNLQDTSIFADEVVNPGSSPSLWTFQTAGLTKIRAVLNNSGGTSITITGTASPQPAIPPRSDGVPTTIQKASAASTGLVATLAKAFAYDNGPGNSIIVECAVGNNTAPTVTDSAGNTYQQAALQANSTTFETAIFVAVGTIQGPNTVTVTNGGATASIAMTIYEVAGLVTQVVAQPDQVATNSGTSGTASTSAIVPASPNEIAFACVAIGTAAQTITPASGWTNDSGQQNPTTPAGFYSFVSMSQFLGSLAAITPKATFTSEPWAMACATFRPIVQGFEGTVNLASPYPLGAVPKNATSGDVAAATAAATLPAVAGKTTWITGFTFTSTGSTGATTVDITVTDGTWTITFVYASVAGATLANPILDIKFPYPLPASTANTTIVASAPSLGSGNLHACTNAYGFQL